MLTPSPWFSKRKGFCSHWEIGNRWVAHAGRLPHLCQDTLLAPWAIRIAAQPSVVLSWVENYWQEGGVPGPAWFSCMGLSLKARRDWHEIVKVAKSKDQQPRLLYPAKLSFRIKGQIKSFQDKKGLKDFITTKPVVQETLEGLL